MKTPTASALFSREIIFSQKFSREFDTCEKQGDNFSPLAEKLRSEVKFHVLSAYLFNSIAAISEQVINMFLSIVDNFSLMEGTLCKFSSIDGNL